MSHTSNRFRHIQKSLGALLIGVMASTSFLGATANANYSNNGYEDVVITNSDTPYFPDTIAGSLEATASTYLAHRGIIGGRPDGTFAGSESVNRAEGAKFLLLSAGVDTSTFIDNGQFPDVKRGEWYVKYVMKAAELSVINGYPDGTFRPANTINSAEFLKMLSQTFSIAPGKYTQNYSDVQASDWFYSYAGVAQEFNLFPERPTEQLQPAKLLTRKEVAIAMYQFLTQAQDGNNGSGNQDTTAPIFIQKFGGHDKTEVNRNETDVTVLKLNFKSTKESQVENIQFKRIGDGSFEDFEDLWVEVDGARVSANIEPDSDTIVVDTNFLITPTRSKTIELKANIHFSADRGTRSRWVLFLPEWITADHNAHGFFPFGGDDIIIR